MPPLILTPRQATKLALAYRVWWRRHGKPPVVPHLHPVYGCPLWWFGREVVIRDFALGHLLPGRA